MPLTPEQKYKLVVDSGLDPNEYTWDESDTTGTDALNPAPAALPPPPMTAMQAVGSRLARSVGPGLLSLPAMAGGAELGSTLGPIGTVAGGLIGGLGGGYIGQKIQEPIFKYFESPDSYQKGVEDYMKAGQQFPKLSVVSDYAPIGLAMGPGALGDAAKGLGKLAFPSKLLAPSLGMASKLDLAEKAALIGSGSGGVLGAGSEAIKQAVSEPGQPMDYGRIATAGVAGALLNKPYGPLGNRLFGGHLPPESLPPANQPLANIVSGERPPGSPIDSAEIPTVKTTPIVTTEGSTEPLTTDEQKVLSGEVKPSYTTDQNPIVKAGEPLNRPAVEEGINSDPTEKFYSEVKPIEEPKLPNKYVGLDNPAVEPEAITSLKAGEVAPVEDTLEPTISEADRQSSRTLAAKRGVTLTEPKSIISDVTGQEAKGYSIPEDRQAAISDIATRDTGPHEIAGHQYLDDLTKSTLQSDRTFAERGLRAAGGDPEALAEAVGKRAVDIQDKPLKSWVQDFWSNTKRLAKFGGNEDDINLFARRALDDRPYSESPELYESTPETRSADVNTLKTKLYSEIGNGEIPEEGKQQSKGLIKPTTSLVDTMIAKGGSDKIAGEAYRNFEAQQRSNTGQFTNPLVIAAKKIKSKEDAARYIYDMTTNDGKPTKYINPTDKAIIDSEIHPVLKEVHAVQNKEGLLVNGREAQDNPNYRGPLMTNSKTLKILTEHPATSSDRQALVKQFVDYHLAKGDVETPAEAKAMLNDYLRGLQSKNGTGQFNALRKAEGVGIPWEWMEKDPVKLFSRYGSRASRDLAMFKHIQNIPEVRAAFGIPDQYGSTKSNSLIPPAIGKERDVALNRITGQQTSQANLISSVEHFVRSLILGPVTGVKNLTNSISQLLPYVPVRDFPKVISAWKYISKGMADGLSTGVIRPSITDLEVGNTSEGFGRVADALRTFGDSIRHYTGANYLEQVSRAHTMALGEILTRAYAGRAASGDIDAIRFLKQFAPEDFNAKNLTEDMLRETAANFVERVQGTYGGRGLPAFLLEPSSPAYSLMSLSKWSVEKSNIIKQDVFNPALKGDFGPLIRYTLGSLATGELISQISQAMFNKKAQTPNLTELQDKGRAQDWAYKATELMWLASYGGILSDAAKAVADKITGQKVKGPSMPSYQVITEMASNITDAGDAVASGENPIDVGLALINDILIGNVQALKVAYNYSPLATDQLDRQDKFRDVKVYNRMAGKDPGQVPDNYDKYKGLSERQFKQAKTVEEGQKIYNEEIKPKLDKLSKDDKKSEVKSLRTNNYEVAPEDFRQSREYYSYIARTQGQAAADALKLDKKTQDSVNRKKSHLVR